MGASEEPPTDILPVEQADAAERPSLIGRTLGRFTIIEPLSTGGSGEVFRAEQVQLGRSAVIKVLRSDVANMPNRIERFLREAKLASRLDHPYAAHIYAFGAEPDNVMWIAMEHVKGITLDQLVETRGAIAANMFAPLFVRLCEVVHSVHELGIVHRDIKGANVMVIERSGQLLPKLLDFGIAKADEPEIAVSQSDEGLLTGHGATLGSPHYMSPEQWERPSSVDARSDIYALGVLAYRCLAGQLPFHLTNRQELTEAHTKGAVPPLPDFVPTPLADVVMRALAKKPEDRWSSAIELAQAVQRISKAATDMQPAKPRGLARLRRGHLVVAAVIAGAGVIGALTYSSPRHVARQGARATSGTPIQILVADFHNTTGEPLFDGALEITLGMALEEAPLITSYSRGYAHKALRARGKTTLDQDAARQFANSEGIDAVVSGTVAKVGPGFAISIRAVDARTGRIIVQAERQVVLQDQALLAIAELAVPIRRAFGDKTPGTLQRSTLGRFTNRSLAAANAYAKARELLDTMDNRGAIPALQHVVELEPDFAVAYTGLAASYLNLGEADQARHAFDLAFARIDRMSDRQQFVVRGMFYATQGQQQKALDVYTKMLERFPDDRTALRHLAQTHAMMGQFTQALAVTQRIIERSPKDLKAQSNAANYKLSIGDFQGAIDQAKRVPFAPDEPGERTTIGIAYVLLGKSSEGEAMFRELTTVPGGASIGAYSLASLAVMEGRTRDALAVVEPAIAGDREHHDEYGAAVKEWLRGYVYRVRGDTAKAIDAFDRAIATSPDTGVAFLSAREYIAIDAIDKAKHIAAQLAKRIETQNQTAAEILEADLALHEGRPNDAVRMLEAAKQSLDTWFGTFDLGLAYLAAGAFPQAHEAMSDCIQRRGELGLLFAVVPPTWYYLGRAQEGLKSPAAAESYRMYITSRRSADADLYLDDAQRRLSSLTR